MLCIKFKSAVYKFNSRYCCVFFHTSLYVSGNKLYNNVFFIGTLFGLIIKRDSNVLKIKTMLILVKTINNKNMRSFILFILMGSYFLFSNNSYSGEVNNYPAGEQLNDSRIKVVSSPDVSELTSVLVSKYNQIKTGRKLSASTGTADFADGTIYFFTSSSPIAGETRMSEKIVVGHEIIVPVINERNPMLEKLYEQGLKDKDFSLLLSASPEWSKLKPGAGNVPLHVYIYETPSLVSKLADFCGMDESKIAAGRVASAEELLATVRRDIYAVGFFKLSDVLNAGKNEFTEQICIVPIDKNQNGKLDAFENIYSSPDELIRGVWIGKYPRKLSSKIYAASASAGYDEASVDFLDWVITDGQEILISLGYNNLLTREKTSGMQTLRPVSPTDGAAPVPYGPNIWVMVLGTAAFIILIVVFTRARLKRKHGISSEDIEVTPALNVESILAPAGLFYDKTHTWAFMEQDGMVKVGIDDFLQHVTGPLSQVKMKEPGEKVRKGEKILTIIQQGKQLDIYSPVTGQIKTQNQTLINNPSQINSDPYLSGWVYQIEPSNWLRETKFMFMADKFNEWLEDEFVRLKDFLAASANSNAVVYNHIVLQDGGELTNNVLAGLEPEVWEDFQTKFIDVSR